jgi:hypothetical protein
VTRLALAAVAALALAAAGCGGVESGSQPWVESEPDFARAAERTRALPSYAYELRGDEFHLGDREEFVCSGGVDNVRPSASQVCEGGTMDGTERRAIGDTSYHWNVRTAKWHRSPDEDFMVSFSSTAPEMYFGFVELADGANRLGDVDVRGEPTVRYELTYGCERIETCVEGEVDVWIDGEGLIRRVETYFEPYTYRWEFFDFGVPVEVTQPLRDEIEEPRERVEVPCGSQPAGPITVKDAIDTFGRHGFDLVSGPSQWKCFEGVAGHLVSRGDWGQVVESSGSVICTVSAEGWEGGSPQHDLYHHQASNYVENLGCQLAADGGRVPERVAAFEAALKELKRKHGS